MENLEMFLLLLFILVLSSILGTVLISKVPSQLHTPLMSCTNAISAITVVGAIIGIASGITRHGVGSVQFILCFIAIILATINGVGGYMVTDRMLAMFRPKEDKK